MRMLSKQINTYYVVNRILRIIYDIRFVTTMVGAIYVCPESFMEVFMFGSWRWQHTRWLWAAYSRQNTLPSQKIATNVQMMTRDIDWSITAAAPDLARAATDESNRPLSKIVFCITKKQWRCSAELLRQRLVYPSSASATICKSILSVPWSMM